VLLGAADFVVLAIPDSAQSHGFMHRQQLQLMKPGAFIINLGRGGLLPREDLLDALSTGTIAGAGLDVFWQEPPDPADPIFDHNVIATPHIAGATDISAKGILKGVSENIRRLVDGENVLNRFC
jgi:phosphoglycerate dehydrogenase-like enzyme